MSQKPPATIGNTVKKAIRHLDESKGSSFTDIKKYLMTLRKDTGSMPESTSIKHYLKNAVDKGTLLKLDNGNYKIKETARRRRSRSRSRSKGKSKRRSRSRSKKRSGGRRRSRSGSRRRKRSTSGKRRKRSSSGRRRKRSSSGRRRKARRSKATPDDVE